MRMFTRVVNRQSQVGFVPGRGIMLQKDPHFLFFYFASGTYPSCDTYLPCDLMWSLLWPVVQVTLLSLWHLLFHPYQFHLFISHHCSCDLLFSVTLLFCDAYCTSDFIVLFYYKYWQSWALQASDLTFVSYGTDKQSESFSPLSSLVLLSQGYSL